MTSNLSLDQINNLLDRENNKDTNIKITRSIGATVEYLDVLVENNQGQLKTSVFHKPAAEPYILPYLLEHSRHIHSNIVNGALFRAVRLCSNVQDFDRERLNIELTLLLNGYPPKFIYYHINRFFQQNEAKSVWEQLDTEMFKKLHKTLISRPTRRERQRNQRAATTTNVTTYSSNQIQEQPQQDSNRRQFNVHFTFQSGPTLKLKRELHQLWKKYYIYKSSPMNNVCLNIGTRSNKSLNQLLVKKRPPKAMLTSASSTVEA